MRRTCTSRSSSTSARTSPRCGPESIDTHEFVWERYTADWLRTSVSAYWYKAESLITLTATDDPAAFLGVTYVNEGEVRAKGLELEAQMRLWRGAEGHMSYALQDATDQATGATLAELSASDGQGARERSALRSRVVAGGRGPRDRQPADHRRQLGSAPQRRRT